MFSRFALRVAATLAVAGCSTHGGGREVVDVDAAIASACHDPSAPRCTPTADCNAGGFCGMPALPAGQACGAGGEPSTCEMAIDPCPGWALYAGKEEVDDYACSCVDGKWACGLCVKGGSLCDPYDGGGG